MAGKLFKASKGTPQYLEWLCKYNLKRYKHDKINGETNRDSTQNTDIFDAVLKAFDSAFRFAGPEAESIFNVLARCSEPDAQNNAGSSGLTPLQLEVKALLTETKDLELDYASLEENYLRADTRTEGAESRLYLDAEDRSFIVKAVDPLQNSTSLLDWLITRVIFHNLLFPETAYEVHGFSRDENDVLRFILSQPFVKGVSAEQHEIDSWLSRLGFKQDENNQWHKNDLYISDTNYKNCLKDEVTGDIYSIDEVLSFKS